MLNGSKPFQTHVNSSYIGVLSHRSCEEGPVVRGKASGILKGGSISGGSLPGCGLAAGLGSASYILYFQKVQIIFSTSFDARQF